MREKFFMEEKLDRFAKDDGSQMYECPVCGREFYAPDSNMWGFYKFVRGNAYENYNRRLFCGWNCVRKWEKKYGEGKYTTLTDIEEEDEEA